jgi:hypothetical protein
MAPPPDPGTGNPRNPAAPPNYPPELQRVLQSLGWSDWQQANPQRPVTMRDIAQFGRDHARVVSSRTKRGGQRRRVQISRQGLDSLKPGGANAHLAPLFRQPSGQQLYDVAQDGDKSRSAYVGKTGKPLGRRLLEHLLTDRELVGRRLRQLGDQDLERLQILTGAFTADDLGRRSHLGEVLLQELHNPTWNDPSKHGFMDELRQTGEVT